MISWWCLLAFVCGAVIGFYIGEYVAFARCFKRLKRQMELRIEDE